MQLAGAVVGGVLKGVIRTWARVFDIGAPDLLGTKLEHGPKRRDPVVLINGFGCDNEMWDAFAASLVRDGFDVTIADLPNKALGEIGATGKVVKQLVDDVRRRTGARKVDLVGYSEGGLIARDVIRFQGGLDAIDAVVTLGTPHQGVLTPKLNGAAARLGSVLPAAARQMIAGSDYLTRLNAGDPTPGRIKYTSIMGKGWDGIVWPGSAAVLEGATNIALPKEGRIPLGTGLHHGQMIQSSHAAYLATRAALLA